MLTQNNKISMRQFQLLLILDIFGVGVMTLPRRAAVFAGADGWLCVLAAGLIAVFVSLIYSSIVKMFPGDSFARYSSKILSKPVGSIICLLFSVKLILTCALELRIFGEILRQTILIKTPYAVIAAVMLSPCVYLAAKGFEARGRMAEILIFAVIVPIAAVFAASAGDIDFSNLKPVFAAEPEALVKGSFEAVSAFTGLELCLVALPFVRSKGDIKKGAAAVTALVGVMFAAVTCLTVARFGAADTGRMQFPVLELMNAADLPGSFIEKQDALVMGFYILSAFAAVNAYLFFAGMTAGDFINGSGRSENGRGRPSLRLAAVAAIVFLLSFIPEDMTRAYDFKMIMFRTFGTAFFAVIPAVLLVTAKIRGLGKRRNG